MAAKNDQAPAIIYNLFPRLFATIDDWTEHVEKIAEMKFNSVYVNPFHEVGGSQSLYAVRDYFKLNADFLPKGSKTDDFAPLKKFLDACKAAGLMVYMDLVINHTANESPLVTKYPKWYKHNPDGTVAHPFAIDPGNPGSITVWGDLSEIEFEDNPDFDGMIKYWDSMVEFYQKLGINGFRCDAAYKIPRRAWEPLIKNARKRAPGAVFLAESLGCTVEQTLALNGCGFDYLFNSSKWWNFEGPWCLEQHNQFRSIAPSISFPESHDTTRLMADQPGTLEMQKNRYVLAAIFSKGLMVTVGYEHCAKKQINVVNTRPSDMMMSPHWNLSSWIAKVNTLKTATPAMCVEGQWKMHGSYDHDLLFLEKRMDDGKPGMGVLINKDWHNRRHVNRSEIPGDFGSFRKMYKIFDDRMKPLDNAGDVDMIASEIVLFI
ncbi:MAG: alpha-amylase family glycosyl hydrolase [Chitinispirillia bacterium]|nr:alpha-amylase family glycosyl hydrolase [Chitinispirillia bacterium]MCL2241094.1 alpha-amylase family glycosyl hydrolase [Chitinispirillia bacterium]